MEMHRYAGLKLRAQRKKLNLTEDAVAKTLSIPKYALTAVELCLNVSPSLWKHYAEAMLALYGVTYEALPEVPEPRIKPSRNRHIRKLEQLIQLVDVGYDVYPQSGHRATVDFIGFTQMADMHEAIEIMRKSNPYLNATIYNANLVAISL